MIIDERLKLDELDGALDRCFALAGGKIRDLDASWDTSLGTPVFTVQGKYTTRGWTEWTEGFLYGCQLLQYDATGDAWFLERGRAHTRARMAGHVSHMGVHDHGFNNVSTYGNLWRLAREGKIEASGAERDFWELALKLSGAVQARRWTMIADGSGFIYSFNGPHSLFSDTIRSCRVLVLGHLLGHVLMDENDRSVSLIERAMQHMRNTLKYNVFHGDGRDAYDVRGRVAHEGIFNLNDGNYRCPSTQQGYSPFSTWTRGLAWILLGCAEDLECFSRMHRNRWERHDPDGQFLALLEHGARATADFYLDHTSADGIPFWDTGAPGIAALGDYRTMRSQPDNPHEPVDSSAAVIAAQGLLRLGHHLGEGGKRYVQAGLTVARTLLQAPYLSEDPAHQGLLLHSVYHRPNGWDHVPDGAQVPQGESSMWGDYHLMELAVFLRRLQRKEPRLSFYGPEDLLS